MKINFTLLVSISIFLTMNLIFSQDLYKRIQINNIDQNTIDLLNEAGIDLTCGAVIENDALKIEVGTSGLDLISSKGIPYTVLIDDMTKFYSERAIKDLPKASRELAQMKAQSSALRSQSVSAILNNVGQYEGCNEIDWAVPANWNINDAANYPSETNHFGGCLTYDMVLQELDDMRSLYPNLISAKANASPTGQTTAEGRTVYYVRISDNPDTDESNEPETLYQSLIHSREAATVMNQLFFMWYILENYNTDPAIKNMVDNQELYFIPVFNPDGFVYNQTIAPNGGGGQRKNRNASAGSCSTYLYGIDLNRNSAYYWGNGGSSTNPCNDTYMGTGPFSEVETQVMRDFCLNHDFKFALNHHSYKNAALHAYAGVFQTNSRADEYSKYNYDMTYYNRFAHGPSTEISYINSGNMNDWMQGGPAGTSANGTPTGTGSGKNTLSWTPENGLSSQGTGGTYGGFWPAPSQYVVIAKNAMRMNFLAAYYTGKYAKLHDFNPSNITATSGNLKFAIENFGQTASNFTLTVTPVSANMLSVGAPSVQSGMGILQQNNVSIAYTLSPSIQANDDIEFKVTLTNNNSTNNVIYEANIVKKFNPTVLVNDNPDETNLTNWTSSGGTWYTTATAYSGTKAITSTATAPYANSESKTLRLNSALNLTNIPVTVIQFYGKWDLERSFDYAQLEASTDGSTWTPLCGRLTKPGAPNANNTYANKTTTENNFQPDGEALYDGDTQGKWYMEEVVIDATNNSSFYNKSTVYLRFDFKTDTSNRQDAYTNANFEGFTFDDFKVIAIQAPCVLSVPTGVAATSITDTSATINWNNVATATYDLQYRVIGAPSWTTVSNIATNTYDLSGLTASTNYEVQVRSKCTSNTSAFSASTNFTTNAFIPCSGTLISSFPYNESFEGSGSGGLGDWTQYTIAPDTFDWSINSGGTPTTNTGPTGTPMGGGTYYLYTEADGNTGGNTIINSPCFNLNNRTSPNFSYSYSMYGSNMGSLTLQISTNNGTSWTNLWTASGDKGTEWLTNTISLSAYVNQYIRLRFMAVMPTKGNSRSDIAIDKISFTATSSAPTTWYRDLDGDTFGNPSVNQIAVSQPVGYVANNTDCDDNNAAINPNTVWYLDADNDSYSISSVTQCDSPGAGYKLSVTGSGDCNDSNGDINPGATEVCDGIDNNCDGNIDEGLLTTYYLDDDDDGFGNPSSSVDACSQPFGYVTNNTDCNDSNDTINPNTVWYLDADNDNYAISSVTQCASPGAGYKLSVIGSGDCDDSNSAINPNTVLYIDTDNDGICDSLDQCPGLDDALIGTPCDDGNPCTINDVYDNQCDCVGTFVDSDGDTVCDAFDLCPGGDDTIDMNQNGTPDCLENVCEPFVAGFAVNPLTHSGSIPSITNLSLPLNSQDASFTITGIDQVTNGKPSDRYIDLVSVSYVDGNNNTQSAGTFSGANVSSANVSITGKVKSITVSLSDGYNGNASVTMSVNLGVVTYCVPSSPAARFAGSTKETTASLGETIKIYPNPASSQLFVERLNSNFNVTISMYNITGQLIKQMDMKTNRQVINVDQLYEGIYLLRLISDNGEVLKIERIIIK